MGWSWPFSLPLTAVVVFVLVLVSSLVSLPVRAQHSPGASPPPPPPQFAPPQRPQPPERSQPPDFQFPAQSLSGPAVLLYPELQVVPRASDRLELEARKEEEGTAGRWKTFVPFQVSALTTLIAASLAAAKPTTAQDSDQTIKTVQDDFSWAQKTSYLVGGIWFGLSAYMWSAYRPYSSALKEKELRSTGTAGDHSGSRGAKIQLSMEQELFRERLAEEKILEAGSTGAVMVRFSLITNLLANAYLMSKSDTTGQIVGGLGVLASLAPWIFRPYWSSVRDYHLDYKRKIFSPIVFKDSRGEWTPGFTWAMNF